VHNACDSVFGETRDLGNWRHDLVEQENVWGKAIHRIVTENITEEQAVDEAIARIKQVLSE
jgi:multiple sugar transport system substrate-binding protein